MRRVAISKSTIKAGHATFPRRRRSPTHFVPTMRRHRECVIEKFGAILRKAHEKARHDAKSEPAAIGFTTSLSQ
jgi:hypothetical protein